MIYIIEMKTKTEGIKLWRRFPAHDAEEAVILARQEYPGYTTYDVVRVEEDPNTKRGKS